MITFQRASIKEHRNELLQVNVEYANWFEEELKKGFGVSLAPFLGKPVPEYVDDVLDHICGDEPPRGVFYLIRVDEQLAGMCGLRRVRPDTGEIKRVFLRANHRGSRLGGRMIAKLIEDARDLGLRRLLIDTAPFMTSAHRVYETAGFIDCPVFPEAETPVALYSACPGWRFMQREV